MIEYLKSLLRIRFFVSTRWVNASSKAIYLYRSNRMYPDSEASRTVLFAAGLTTSDSWCGIRGMLVFGCFPDCTGGHQATRAYHFNLLGMNNVACMTRRPYWFWRPYLRLSTWLQYLVDTRRFSRKPVLYHARKVHVGRKPVLYRARKVHALQNVRENSAGNS